MGGARRACMCMCMRVGVARVSVSENGAPSENLDARWQEILEQQAKAQLRWTPSVGQDQATIKWDSCTSPCDTETRWSEHLLSFSSSSSSTVSP